MTAVAVTAAEAAAGAARAEVVVASATGAAVVASAAAAAAAAEAAAVGRAARWLNAVAMRTGHVFWHGPRAGRGVAAGHRGG